MPRKSAQPKDPASLPGVLIPPSEAAANEKSAYWLQLIQNPEEFKAAVATEDFFPMIASFPEAFWSDNRLSLYLYRLEDDGVAIRNVEGKKKYIAVYHQPVDEDTVSRKFGGGKFRLYLKLDSRETLREFTFWIDGAPKAQAGQIVEVDGKPVSLTGAAQHPAPETTTDIARVIDASADANAKSQELLTHAAKASIDMVRDQATSAAQPPRNPLDDIKTLLEIVRPQPPTPDPVQAALMSKIIDKAFAEPKTIEPEEKETPVEKTLEAIKELSGGMSLADLMKPAAKAAAADPVAAWAPIVTTIGSVVGQIFEKLPTLQAQRNEAMRLEIHLRTLRLRENGQAGNQPLPELPPAPAPLKLGPQVVEQQPASINPTQFMETLVRHVIAGFKKAPVGEWGENTAAAMDFHFSDGIDALGIGDTLSDPEKLKAFVDGVAPLKELSTDARWGMFFEDFSTYCADRWGKQDDGKIKPIDGASAS